MADTKTPAPDAERLLADPLLVGAFGTIEARVIDAMRRVPIGDTQAQQSLILTLQSVQAVRGYLQEIVTTGKLERLAEEESKARRLMRKVIG